MIAAADLRRPAGKQDGWSCQVVVRRGFSDGTPQAVYDTVQVRAEAARRGGDFGLGTRDPSRGVLLNQRTSLFS